jgi:nitroreductase
LSERAEPHPILELIHRRATAEDFDSARPVPDELIRALVGDATRAPSSFNLQHWRFIALRRPADKERLRRVAYGQAQVSRAAVTFVVLGDIEAVERLPAILDVAVERGAISAGKAAAWVRMAREIYADRGAARDEAIRSASLAAMTMMLAAEARGLVAGALSGFDPGRLCREFRIAERYVPVLLLAVGYAASPASPTAARMPRLGVAEVLAFDRWPQR